MALTTVANFKTFIGDSSSTNDTVYGNIIDSVSAFVENYCNRTFDSTTYTNEVYDGTGTIYLRLKNYPITTFTRLQERARWDNTDDWETISSQNYYYDTNEGVITKTSNFSMGKQNYRVTYVAGYSTIPADLQLAVWQMTRDIFNHRKSSGDVTSEKLKDYSITYGEVASMVTDEVRMTLDIYRDLEV